MKTKKVIDNSFLELLSYILSFILSFFRSIKTLFGGTKSNENKFFELLDYLFRGWTKKLWGKPSLYKILSWPADVLNYIFKNK